jgi:hypothetical protein
MGGNVDYTGGMVLQSLLREAIWVAVQPRPDGTIRILNPGAVQFGWGPHLELKMSDLFLKALRMVDAVIASASLYFTPLFGVALAYSVLKERLAPQAVLGSGIILFATLILFRFDTPLNGSETIASV